MKQTCRSTCPGTGPVRSKHDALFLKKKWYPSGIENESRLVGKIVITNWTQTTKWCQPVYQSLTTSYHNQYCGNSIDF